MVGKMTGSTFHCCHLLGESGWLENVRMRVDENGTIKELGQGFPEASDILLNGPVIPGMPNCHSHSFQRQMAGLAGIPGPAGEDSFWTWRETMYALANRLDADSFESIAHWLYLEMLEAGYTSCAEFHYLHHDPDGHVYPQIDELGARLLNAATRAGISLTLVPVLYCRAGFKQSSAAPQQKRFVNDSKRFMSIFERSLERVGAYSQHAVGLGLHSLRAVSGLQMQAVLEAEGGRAAAIHIHVAEQAAEVEQCLETYGARPVQWLLENARVDHRWCLVHATHMDDSEYRQVADSGAVVGLCPTTEADLGDGFFEGERFLQLGGRIAIGSDSNLRLSPCEELRLLEFGMRLRSGRRNVMTLNGEGCGNTLYTAAVAGGAAALGQPIGVIATGKRADLLELDTTHPMLCGVSKNDILERYVFAGGKSMIKTVFVAGRERVRGGVHPNREAAAEEFSAVMEELEK